MLAQKATADQMLQECGVGRGRRGAAAAAQPDGTGAADDAALRPTG